MANNPKNYNDSSPAIPSGKAGVKWQAATPDTNPAVVRDVSAYVDPCTATTPGAVPTPPNDATKFLDGTGAFSALPGSLTNPMTTLGDLIVGGTSGTPARLGIGSSGQVPTVVSGAIAWQTPSGGGGGGGAPLTNVVALPGFSGSNNYAGFTVFGLLGSRQLILNPSTWKFGIQPNVAGIGILDSAVVYRTLKDSLTIIDVTTVLYSGSPGINPIPGGENFSDSIALAIDMTHDYYIAVYFDPGAGAAMKNFSTPTGATGILGGYASGNQTTLTGGGSIPALTTVECILSQVVALS